MRSTFYGLEIARSALVASQTSMDVALNNVSNADTTGYTRQRLVTYAKPAAAGNSFLADGTLKTTAGGGVYSDYISQMRDVFLDLQFREETTATSYAKTLNDEFSWVTSIFNSEIANEATSNISGALNDFYTALDNWAQNASSLEVRTSVQQSALSLTETIRYYYSKLEDQYGDTDFNITTQVNRINAISDELTDLNTQIYRIELVGGMANELRDERNLLLDELSGYVPITYEDKEGNNFSVWIGADAASKSDEALLVQGSHTTRHLAAMQTQKSVLPDPNDITITDRVAQINTRAAKIADLNNQIQTKIAAGEDYSDLQLKRDVLAGELKNYTDIMISGTDAANNYTIYIGKKAVDKNTADILVNKDVSNTLGVKNGGAIWTADDSAADIVPKSGLEPPYEDELNIHALYWLEEEPSIGFDTKMQSWVDTINGYADKIKNFNTQILAETDPARKADLQTECEKLITGLLSDYTNGEVSYRKEADGTYSVWVGDGYATKADASLLVSGTNEPRDLIVEKGKICWDDADSLSEIKTDLDPLTDRINELAGKINTVNVNIQAALAIDPKADISTLQKERDGYITELRNYTSVSVGGQDLGNTYTLWIGANAEKCQEIDKLLSGVGTGWPRQLGVDAVNHTINWVDNGKIADIDTGKSGWCEKINELGTKILALNEEIQTYVEKSKPIPAELTAKRDLLVEGLKLYTDVSTGGSDANNDYTVYVGTATGTPPEVAKTEKNVLVTGSEKQRELFVKENGGNVEIWWKAYYDPSGVENDPTQIINSINSDAEQIQTLNQQIYNGKTAGTDTTALETQRQALLDDIRQYTNVATGGSDNDNTFTVYIGQDVTDGATKYEGRPADMLVLGGDTLRRELIRETEGNTIDWSNEPAVWKYADKYTFKAVSSSFTAGAQGGSLQALIDFRDGSTENNIGIPYVVNGLNDLCRKVTSEVNAIHCTGYTLPCDDGTGTEKSHTGEYMFQMFNSDGTGYCTGDANNATDIDRLQYVNARNFAVSANVLADEDYLAASDMPVLVTGATNTQTDNTVIAKKLLALVQQTDNTVPNNFDSALKSIVGDISSRGDRLISLDKSQTTRLSAIDYQRKSVSSVSTDEEFTNVIKFSKAYNAACRLITIIDEQLDMVVNKMGLVGR